MLTPKEYKSKDQKYVISFIQSLLSHLQATANACGGTKELAIEIERHVYPQNYFTNSKKVPDFLIEIKQHLDLEFLALRNKPGEGLESNDLDCYPPPLKPSKL